jgi:hypothetical protein
MPTPILWPPALPCPALPCPALQSDADQPLPADLPCLDCLAEYTLGPADSPEGLRGSKGVRATATIAKGTIIGPYRCGSLLMPPQSQLPACYI